MVAMLIYLFIFMVSAIGSPLCARSRHRKPDPVVIEQVVPEEPKKNKKFTVHVLLEKKDAQENPSWVITADKGCILRDPYAPQRQELFESSECHVAYEYGSLGIGKKKL